MHCYVEFISTPTTDIPGTLLLLHLNARRYLVGQVPEGAQRLCIERKIGLRKASSILLTGRMQWSNVGGLLGMILELAGIKGNYHNQELTDLKKKLAANGITSIARLKEMSEKITNASRLQIYGPPNLNHLIATGRRFIFREGIPMAIQEYKEANTLPSHEPTWTDEWLRVWVLPIRPVFAKEGSEDGIRSRKRSHDESESGTDTPRSPPAAISNDAIRRSLVSQMFNSDWRADRLITQRLSQVRMPATIFIRDPQTKELVQYKGPLPGGSEPFEDIEVLVREPWPSSLTENLPPTTPKPEAISYIIKNHRQRGKFLPDKAKELKVPRGPLWSRLSSGESVQNLEGETITSDMVLEPGKEGGGCAVIDLPSQHYIDPLLNRPEWSVPEITNGVGVMIWILAPGLASDQRIQDFQAKMSHLKHIVSSPDSCTDLSQLSTATRASLLHNQVDSKVFPLLQEPALTTAGQQVANANAVAAHPGLTYSLEPRLELQKQSKELQLDMSSIASNAAIDIQAAKEMVSAAQAESSKVTSEEPFPHGDAEIVVLGTGSSCPSLTRNVSGTLVRVPGCGSYIFDCGEGSLGVMQRIMSASELDETLRDLRMVWISHLHADHHLGLVSLLQARRRAIKDVPNPGSFAVVSDIAMLQWLYEYSYAEDIGMSSILPIVAAPGNGPANSPTDQRTSLRLVNSALRGDLGDANSTPDFLEKLNLESLNSVYVNHCRGAQAVSVTFRNGLKVSYSGDCRPSAAFTDIGRDSHILIHEATFEDPMRHEAFAKKHSTIGEALIVAGQMKAQACLLTHFSQRYPSMPLSVGVKRKSKDNAESPSVKDLSSVLEDVEDASTQPSASFNEEGSKDQKTAITKADGDQSASRHPLAPPVASNASIKNMMRKGYLARTQVINPADIRQFVEESDVKVIFAFDFMRLKLEDVPRAERLQPVLRDLYSYLQTEYSTKEDEDDDEHDGGDDSNDGSPNVNAAANLSHQRRETGASGSTPEQLQKKKKKKQKPLEASKNSGAKQSSANTKSKASPPSPKQQLKE